MLNLFEHMKPNARRAIYQTKVWTTLSYRSGAAQSTLDGRGYADTLDGRTRVSGPSRTTGQAPLSRFCFRAVHPANLPNDGSTIGRARDQLAQSCMPLSGDATMIAAV